MKGTEKVRRPRRRCNEVNRPPGVETAVAEGRGGHAADDAEPANGNVSRRTVSSAETPERVCVSVPSGSLAGSGGVRRG